MITPHRVALLAAAALALPGPALAQAAGRDAAAKDLACAAAGTTPRARIECLGAAQRESEARLERAIAGAQAAIRAADALQAVQRNRWSRLLDEAQGRFVLWRNFECQNVAPYEDGGARVTIGGRLGGAAAEQRLVCLIACNSARAADLERRYPPPAGWTPPAATGPAEPEALPAAPPAPTRIIELP